jgi:hypothetical protein
VTAIAACRTCGTQPLEHPRFCHGCGSPVEGAGIQAEYKQVTVLFADAVHSMELAGAVGAERLREIIAKVRWPQSRRRTTLFGRAWRRWRSKPRPPGSLPR